MSKHSKGQDWPVELSEEQWRQRLTPAQYRVLREEGTEMPFSSPLNDEHRKGRYVCAGCGAELFRSDTKFDAGCGWPSYHTAAGADVIERVVDKTHGMVRVEVRCRSCGTHLGHVFPDGPEPTGERYCINSAAIDFAPSDSGETRL